jgi:phosphate starvation-inducible protein PhoH and related proteins
LSEVIIQFKDVDPLELLGPNNTKLNIIKLHFPQLKIVARGQQIKAIGAEADMQRFDEAMERLRHHFNRFNSVSNTQLEMVLGGIDSADSALGTDVLVHGNGGRLIKARTENQKKLVKLSEENDMLFALGPAGTGKTYTAVALAVRAMKNKEVKRIILTRPAVEAGENLGFLPGDLKEKLDPYLQPLYDALNDMIPAEKLRYYMENNMVQIAPLAFMRGRTLDHAFVILDEAQNTTPAQMKMFLTRMGQNAKFIITGDTTQVDLPKNQKSGLMEAINILKDVKDIAFITLNEKDVIRHRLVKDIINAYGQKD